MNRIVNNEKPFGSISITINIGENWKRIESSQELTSYQQKTDEIIEKMAKTQLKRQEGFQLRKKYYV